MDKHSPLSPCQDCESRLYTRPPPGLRGVVRRHGRRRDAMRLFSWAGCAALAVAAGVGYGTNELVHRCCETCPAVSFVGVAEASDAVAHAAPNLLPPLPAEEFALTCLPVRMPDDRYRHTVEPPLAGAPGAVRTVGFEMPAPAEGPEVPPVPTVIPFLTDDDAPAPAKLPMMEDDVAAPLANYPVRQ